MHRPSTKKLLPNARTMRKVPSDAERKLWQALRDRQLAGLKFRRQVPAGPFIADFACDEVSLIVEADGDQHGDPDAVKYDADRTKKLEAMGWRVIRFSCSDVVQHLDTVLTSILLAARPHPSPLPLSTTGEGARVAADAAGVAARPSIAAGGI